MDTINNNIMVGVDHSLGMNDNSTTTIITFNKDDGTMRKNKIHSNVDLFDLSEVVSDKISEISPCMVFFDRLGHGDELADMVIHRVNQNTRIHLDYKGLVHYV